MRIGISGTHCSGKTTLMRALGEKYNTYTIAGVADKFPRESRNKLSVQTRIFKALVDAELVEPAFISDRTVFDNYVYLMRVYSNEPKTIQSASVVGNYMGSLFTHLTKHPYDAIVFVDEWLDFEDNGTRNMKEDQIAVFCDLDETMNFLPRIFNIPVIKVVGTTEERIDQVSGILDRIHSQKRVSDFVST